MDINTTSLSHTAPGRARGESVLFIDRDGTILREPADEQIDSFEKFHFVPGAISALRFLRQHTDYLFVLVSNQDGLGTPSYPEDTFWPTQNLMLEILEGEGVTFDDILIDRSFPEDNLPTRKPGTAMLTKYMDGSFDLASSYVIGDRSSDAQLAKNLGCKALIIDEGACDGCSAPHEGPLAESHCTVVSSWQRIADIVFAGLRRATVTRTTRETDISVTLDLDGNGNANISTGLGFFDHMLEQIARHGNIDLEISARGDLHVDEHHTVEDTAIVLGEALAKALGDKRGISRYGFTLPMDDSLASVALDFGGRHWLVWDAEFCRERVGDVPTELFFHFFKSLSDAARLNLNIRAEGTNEHHKIEAIFKAFARALRMALQRDITNMQLPSSKGTL
jgi:imidazoleglycerol-phosphate dehydratase/histidinol-phosphatase